jgi:hypothetical protein
MANAGPVTREFRTQTLACLVAPKRTRVAPRPAPVRLVAVAAALMVLLAVGTIVAVSLGAPPAVFLPLALLALLVRPVVVLRHRVRQN